VENYFKISLVVSSAIFEVEDDVELRFRQLMEKVLSSDTALSVERLTVEEAKDFSEKHPRR